MPKVLAEFYPWIALALGIVVPILTLYFAQKNKKADTSRLAGQQLVDNLFKEKDGLLKEKDGLRADVAAAKKETETAEKKALAADAEAREIEVRLRALQQLHDDMLTEWIEVGTTRAEELAKARFAYAQRQKFTADNPGKDVRL